MSYTQSERQCHIGMFGLINLIGNTRGQSRDHTSLSWKSKEVKQGEIE